jgi:hypothetical protein
MLTFPDHVFDPAEAAKECAPALSETVSVLVAPHAGALDSGVDSVPADFPSMLMLIDAL